MEFIDLNKADSDEGSSIKVQKFTLDYPDDADQYQNLLNDESVRVVKDVFSYDRAGRAVITVW